MSDSPSHAIAEPAPGQRPGGITAPRQNWADIFYTSHDGLTLHARRYGIPNDAARPLVCLSGLTRNARDFHDLATFLADDPIRPREVYALDYRGRGSSDFDRNWRNYSPLIELLDTLDFMALAGLHDVAILGTSRGGIIAMMMAVLRPAAMGAAILNDIGPEIDTAGLARIMGYVGKIPLPRSWDEAIALVRLTNEKFFPDLSEADWARLAHQWFNEAGGAPAPGYDPCLAKALSEVDIAKRIPAMWPYFEAMKHIPVMVLRGEHSDLLSQATFERMRREHPNLTAATIPGYGHAPLLQDRLSMRMIGEFLRETDPVWLDEQPIPYDQYPTV